MGTRKRMSVFTFIVAVTLLGPTLSAVAQPSAFSAQPMVASASQPLAFALGGLGNPHPRDMVQIYPVGGPDSFVSNIPPQGVHIAYTVPPDQWLVVVPVIANALTLPGSVPGCTDESLVLYEDFNSQLFYKAECQAPGNLHGSGPLNSMLGWTFRPGSMVVFKNLDGGPKNLRYNLFGYLVKD